MLHFIIVEKWNCTFSPPSPALGLIAQCARSQPLPSWEISLYTLAMACSGAFIHVHLPCMTLAPSRNVTNIYDVQFHFFLVFSFISPFLSLFLVFFFDRSCNENYSLWIFLLWNWKLWATVFPVLLSFRTTTKRMHQIGCVCVCVFNGAHSFFSLKCLLFKYVFIIYRCKALFWMSNRPAQPVQWLRYWSQHFTETFFFLQFSSCTRPCIFISFFSKSCAVFSEHSLIGRTHTHTHTSRFIFLSWATQLYYYYDWVNEIWPNMCGRRLTLSE